MLALKLYHVSKRGHGCQQLWWWQGLPEYSGFNGFVSTEILVVVHDADFSIHITLKFYTNLMPDMAHVKLKKMFIFQITMNIWEEVANCRTLSIICLFFALVFDILFQYQNG